MFKPVRLLTTAAVLALSSLAAHADTIASTFGPGQTYNANVGWLLSNYIDAAPFVPTETVTLTYAALAVDWVSGNAPMNVYIESSVDGSPGTILDTLSQIGTYQTGSSEVVNFVCSSCSQLDAGTLYFLVGQQNDTSTESGWMWSSTNGTFYYNAQGSTTGPWDSEMATLGAFEVDGTPDPTGVTPEPSSIALMGTGLLGAASAIRRRILKA